MFSFFLHISEGKLVLICFDLLTELCSCHRHRLPLCPFNHQSISVDKVFPRKTEIPLFGDCVLSHGCALQQESVRFSGERSFPPQAQPFLARLPRSSNQETRWHFLTIFNKTEHPAFGGGEGGSVCLTQQVTCPKMEVLCSFLLIKLYLPLPSPLGVGDIWPLIAENCQPSRIAAVQPGGAKSLLLQSCHKCGAHLCPLKSTVYNSQAPLAWKVGGCGWPLLGSPQSNSYWEWLVLP